MNEVNGRSELIPGTSVDSVVGTHTTSGVEGGLLSHGKSHSCTVRAFLDPGYCRRRQHLTPGIGDSDVPGSLKQRR